MKRCLIIAMLFISPVCLAEQRVGQDVAQVANDKATGSNSEEIRSQMEELRDELQLLQSKIEIEKLRQQLQSLEVQLDQNEKSPILTEVGTTEKSLIWDERWYLGGGLHLNFNNFRNELSGYDFDDSFGFSLKTGYLPMEYLAIEFLFQYHSKMKATEYGRTSWLYRRGDGTLYMQSGNYEEEVTVEGYDFTLNIKGRYPVGRIAPYGLLGLGYMHGKAKLDYHFKPDSIFAVPHREVYSDSESGPCMRLGVGGDVSISEHFVVNLEVAYNLGYGSVDNIRFTSVNIGSLYFF